MPLIVQQLLLVPACLFAAWVAFSRGNEWDFGGILVALALLIWSIFRP